MKTCLLAWLLVMGSGGVGAQAPAVKGEPLADVSGEEFDARFLGLVQEQHRQGLELARVGAERSERAELDELAAKLAGRMERDLAELEQLAARPAEARSGLGRTGAAAGTNPHPGRGAERPTPTTADDVAGSHADTVARLRAASGDEFNRRFLQAMTKHHHAGYELNQAAAGRAGDREIAAFARRSAMQQQEEIEEMNALYAAWFRP